MIQIPRMRPASRVKNIGFVIDNLVEASKFMQRVKFENHPGPDPMNVLPDKIRDALKDAKEVEKMALDIQQLQDEAAASRKRQNNREYSRKDREGKRLRLLRLQDAAPASPLPILDEMPKPADPSVALKLNPPRHVEMAPTEIDDESMPALSQPVDMYDVVVAEHDFANQSSSSGGSSSEN